MSYIRGKMLTWQSATTGLVTTSNGKKEIEFEPADLQLLALAVLAHDCPRYLSRRGQKALKRKLKAYYEAEDRLAAAAHSRPPLPQEA